MKTSGVLRPKTKNEMSTLMNVALGKQEADLAIVNAKLANVYTAEIQNNMTVTVKDKWIAYVGQNPQGAIGAGTEVIDAGGRTLIPGLIDGHTHLAWLFRPDEFIKHAAGGGTTTVVTETLEPLPVVGYEGLVDFLSSLHNQPIKILATAPSMVSISHAARGITSEDLEKLLDRNDILGLGETYWQVLLQQPEVYLPALEQTRRAGKVLEGHSAGAGDNKLSAYVSTGISSCHEPINAQQVLQGARFGLHIMIREGSIRRDLEPISKILDEDIDLRRLILVTDGISPADLLQKGYMEYVVQKAIDCGFEPIAAIQMATLNVAEHFSLDAEIGGIAPGRLADMVLIPNIETIKATAVISNGQIIARDGELLVTPRRHEFSIKSLNSVHLPQALKPSDFTVKPPDGDSPAKVRVIKMVTDLVTAEEHIDLPVANGLLHPDINQDIIKISAIDRTHNPGKMFTGFIQGFGLKSGAFACSASWDASDIIVAGTRDDDLAAAVNRLFELQGGVVLCDRGSIVCEVPLPVFGMISDLAMEDLAEKLAQVKKNVSERGVSFPDPVLSLITLTGAAIPYLRICEEGLVNLKNGQTVGLYVPEP